jgi:hypothetical protein
MKPADAHAQVRNSSNTSEVVMGLIGKAHEQNKDEMWVSDILTVI